MSKKPVNCRIQLRVVTAVHNPEVVAILILHGSPTRKSCLRDRILIHLKDIRHFTGCVYVPENNIFFTAKVQHSVLAPYTHAKSFSKLLGSSAINKPHVALNKTRFVKIVISFVPHQRKSFVFTVLVKIVHIKETDIFLGSS